MVPAEEHIDIDLGIISPAREVVLAAFGGGSKTDLKRPGLPTKDREISGEAPDINVTGRVDPPPALVREFVAPPHQTTNSTDDMMIFEFTIMAIREYSKLCRRQLIMLL